ncbi:MAG: hypothetical protein AB1782_09550 [Cyanobacteriota bacterium]
MLAKLNMSNATNNGYNKNQQAVRLGQNITFGYKIFVDSGASDPKRGTFKVSLRSDVTGDELLSTKDLPQEYRKVGPKSGFKTAKDYVDGLSSRISKAIELAGEKIAELKGDDKFLTGILINAPGYVVGGSKAPLLPNLKDKDNNSLRDVDFTNIDVKAERSPNGYRVIATNDMHGAAAGIAQILKDKGELQEGLHALICMTGGGMGVVNIKVKNGFLEIEGSETGHNRIVTPGKAKSLERGAASVSALIENYAHKMEMSPEDLKAMIDTGDARSITAALISGSKQEQKAAAYAINKYIDGISQEFARKVTDGVNKIILSGPLALGIKTVLAEKTGNPDELKDQIVKKVYEHMPETGPGSIMADIHHFEVDLNTEIPDNTVGGAILLNSGKFIGKNVRGNWINIPLSEI